ncbi:MAG: GGDEF domain-containing protein [Proteobacteria bacterium]|nr:GGDEF domain-containing protein [Pseudomonadota bacterium]
MATVRYRRHAAVPLFRVGWQPSATCGGSMFAKRRETTNAVDDAVHSEHSGAVLYLLRCGYISNWMLRQGPRKMLFIIIATAVVSSLAIVVPVALWMWQGTFRDMVVITLAVAVPIAIAWPIGLFVTDLAFALDDAWRRAEVEAHTDWTTRLPNRRHFFERGSELLESDSASVKMAAVLVDIDDFKSINDRHGHLVGDRVLFEVAQACRSVLRADVLFARFGGEEFAVLMAVEDARQAHAVGERICKKVTGLALKLHNGEVVRPTVSVGVALGMRVADSIDIMLGRADAAMYAAKRAGKNRAIALDEPDGDYGRFNEAV